MKSLGTSAEGHPRHGGPPPAAAKPVAQVDNFPRADYRSASVHSMRTDALDRLASRRGAAALRRMEIEAMMTAAGLTNIRLHKGPPCRRAADFKA